MTKPSNNSNPAPRNKKRSVRKKSTLKTSGNDARTVGQNYPVSDQKTDPGFYRACEERFRGPRDSIKERLKVYLPFVAPLLELHQPAKVLDLGCGRGEWLELMRDEGFEVQGVDLDQGMLQACRERDLPVLQGEAVSYLKAMDDESCSIVSGFHIVEHIPFEALQELVAEALRVLRPGGLLILETPNPENVVVGTTNFYMDPTHRQPLPPDLLAFLPEYHGFERTKILRLQESVDLAARQDLSLLDVLAGVSPDYAVVAQKKAPAMILEQFNEAFERDYGINLNELAQRYSHNIGSRVEGLEHGLNNVSSQAGEAIKTLSHQAETQSLQLSEAAEKAQTLQQQLNEATAHAAADKARVKQLTAQLSEKEQVLEAKQSELEQLHANSQWLQNEWDTAKAKIDELNHISHHWWTEADRLNRELHAIYAGESWKLTYPLRKAKQWALRLCGILVKVTWGVKTRMQSGTRWAAAFIRRQPKLKAGVLRAVRRVPGLEEKLRRLVRNVGVGPAYSVSSASSCTVNHAGTPRPTPVAAKNPAAGSADPDLPAMTPRARRIYQDLKAAIEKRRLEDN